MALEDVVEYRHVAGLADVSPDHPCMAEQVIEDLVAIQFGNELFGKQACTAFIRVVAAAASSVSQAAFALLVDEHAAKLGGETGSELAILKANMAASAATPAIPKVFAHFFFMRLFEDYERRLASREQWGSTIRDMAVGFVDLVGSTSWAASCTADHQAQAVADFEQAAWEAAVRHGGRIVKFIGDEAMFVAPEPGVALSIALELTRSATDNPCLPAARGAVAYGPVTRRGGDYFGTVVNLISRATKVAAPGTVVVTGEVARVTSSDRSYVQLGEHELRGIGTPVLLYVISAGPENTGHAPGALS